MRLLVLWSVLAAGAAFSATPVTKKAPPAVELKKDFNAGEFEKVIKRADAALKAGGLEPKDVAQYQLWRGQSLLALGREDAARDAFVAAVEAWGDIELDAQRAGPDAVRVFEKAREAVPGTLAVTVINGEASVSVDGKDFGPAPLTTQLTGGKHAVEARGAGELNAKAELEVKPGRRVELALELKVPPVPPPEPKPEPPPLVVTEPVKPVVVEPPKPIVVEAQAGPSRVGLVPLLGGVVIAGAGGLMLWQARVAYDALDDRNRPALTPDEQRAAQSNGPLFQTLGWVGVGVGAAAAVAGVVMLVVAPSSPAQVSAFILPGAGGVNVKLPLPL